ncbi:hypothetical protein [Alcanivorax sp.]|uniref:hypothetical protein n=1 Tax=Alcanivorax sp. TaxID=1872427 RepID=UPI002B27100C|nr:hypothetical protein [Alcanivorax sp.]
MRGRIWLILCLFSPLHAEEMVEAGVKLSGFYSVGVAYYENEEYLDALKHFFAYREANIEMLRGNSAFLEKIDRAIEYCDKKVRGRLARFDRSEKAIGADSVEEFAALHVGSRADEEDGERGRSAASNNLVYRVETLERELQNLKQDQDSIENEGP